MKIWKNAKLYLYATYLPVKFFLAYTLMSENAMCTYYNLFNHWATFLLSFFHLLLLYTFALFVRLICDVDTENKKDVPNFNPYSININGKDINPFISTEIKQKKLNMIKYCSICNCYKPPRSQHCLICETCSLKTQTHSFMINKCISFSIHKFYIIYKVLIMFVNAISIIYFISFFPTQILINTIFIITLAIENICDVYLVIKNIRLLLKNETESEEMAINNFLNGNISTSYVFKEGPITEYIESKDRKVLNPYCLGTKKNFTEVFGDDWKHWLLATSTTKGDGITFTKNYKSDNIFDI